MRGLRHIGHRRHARLVASLIVVMTLAIVLLPAVRETVAATMGGDRATVRAALLDLGPFAPLASIGLNVLQGVLAPVPGFVIPYINGMVFGTVWGALLSWLGGIAAAAVCFGLARTFGRGLAERVCRSHATLDRVNRLVERNGLWAVAVSRLLPGMPFDAFSYLGGLSRVRFWPFIAGTAIGSAPHAYLYALLGEHLDVPMWLGLVLMPVVGLLVAGAHALAGRRRRPLAPAVGVG